MKNKKKGEKDENYEVMAVLLLLYGSKKLAIKTKDINNSSSKNEILKIS
jgi:hypothetical protein